MALVDLSAHAFIAPGDLTQGRCPEAAWRFTERHEDVRLDALLGHPC